jgi:hypothetical protein
MNDIYELEELRMFPNRSMGYAKTFRCPEDMFEKLMEPRMKRLDESSICYKLYRINGTERELIR